MVSSSSCVSMDSMESRAKYDCLLFDMDDTLYPLSLGMNLACRKNIQDYMLQVLQIEDSQVPKMCLDLYREHGTTMAGLKALGYKFDNDEYHAYAHGKLPYKLLKPDPVLKNLLLSMPQRKLIFTNADRVHVEKVLNKMGLEDCFQGIICFETLNGNTDTISSVVTGESLDCNQGFLEESGSDVDFRDGSAILCKPSVESMEAAIRVAKIDPKRTIFFDDSARNIASGKRAGLHTVIVGSSVLIPGADFALESIHNIKEALPELWESEEHPNTVLKTTTVETVVLA